MANLKEIMALQIEDKQQTTTSPR